MPSPRRASLALLGVGTLLIAAAYALAALAPAHRATVPAMIGGVTATTVAFIALGAGRARRRRWLLRGALAVTALALGAGLGVVHVLPTPRAERIVFGLPLRAAVVLYVVGGVPLLLLPLVYAATFETRSATDMSAADEPPSAGA